MDDNVELAAVQIEQQDAPRSLRGPCSSGSRCRPKSSRPCASWDARPLAPASPKPWPRPIDELAERAAACGQYDLFDRAALFDVEALEDRIVLAIDRQEQGRIVLPRFEQRDRRRRPAPLYSQARQKRRDATAAKVGARPARADDRRHHPIGGTARRFNHRVRAGRCLDARARKRFFQRGVLAVVRDHSEFRIDGCLAWRAAHCAARGPTPRPHKPRGRSDQLDGALQPIDPVDPRMVTRRFTCIMMPNSSTLTNWFSASMPIKQILINQYIASFYDLISSPFQRAIADSSRSDAQRC